MPHSAARVTPARERSILFTLAAVQFVNVLDFMMVMPLAFVKHIGLAVGSTASAAMLTTDTGIASSAWSRSALCRWRSWA